MFWTSWPFASGGPISEYWQRADYWHPPYLIDIVIGNWHFGIEDYFAAFSLIGISTAIFEIISLKKGLTAIAAINIKTYLRLKFWGIICIVIVLFEYIIGLKSMTAILIAFAMLAITMQYPHSKILLLSLAASIIFTFFCWIFYCSFFTFIFPNAIHTYWKLNYTLGIMITGIPMEEFIWAFFVSLFLAPMYRICSLEKIKPNKANQLYNY